MTHPRSLRQRLRSRASMWIALVLSLAVLLVGCTNPLTPAAQGIGGSGVKVVNSQSTTTNKPFDPSIGAPLPDHRIVAVYGIVGGVDFNGFASSLDMLNGFLPQLQQLGQQYAALDPVHPVELGLDLVVNTIQPCSAYPQWCASWVNAPTIQAYIDFCEQHNLLLFFDLQLGTEAVEHALTAKDIQTANGVPEYSLLYYLMKYPFTEVALDTEFHFPNTPQGYQDALGYPCCLGWMMASEINWTINELAQISLQQHLPRKVLVIHEWNSGVLPDKDNIRLNPDVSVVLQSDGWGYVSTKLGDYQVFVQQDLLQYGGYKRFLQHPDGTEFDVPQQTPQDVMQLFPQPLFISYQ